MRSFPLTVLLTAALCGCSRVGVRVGPPVAAPEAIDIAGSPASPPFSMASGRLAGTEDPAPGAGSSTPRSEGSDPRGGGSDMESREARSIRQATEEAAIKSALELVASKRTVHTINPSDLLEIAVYQEPDLQRTVRVNHEGAINMPMVGEIKVGGLSVAQAEKAIFDKLKRYIVQPQVSVFVREYANKKVYVLGQVRNPGSYPLPEAGPLTVIGAVALAGGFTDYAASNRTRVIRSRDGRTETIVVEVKTLTKGGEKSKDKDFLLEPNDVVFVPESFF